MPDRSVTEIMSTPVRTLAPDTPATEAANDLADSGFGALPVVDADGRLLGVLDDDDLLIADGDLHGPTMFYLLGAVIPLPGQMKHVEEELHKVAASTVADLMDADVPTVTADATIEDVATLMHERNVTHVPVIDGDRIVLGIVARGDVVRFIARTDLTN
jgi:CBS domain-containing protein